MRHKTNTRSSLFLMELIIAILFFSLASAVCLRMFAKSHQLSTDASAGNQAVNQTVNVAELIRYDLQNGTRTLSDTYPEADILYSVVSNAADVYNGSVIYFDKSWESCSADLAEYRLVIQAQDSSATLRKYMLSMYSLSDTVDSDTVDSDATDCIYELPLSIHIAREVGAHE